jgi:hypothetical protein
LSQSRFLFSILSQEYSELSLILVKMYDIVIVDNVEKYRIFVFAKTFSRKSASGFIVPSGRHQQAETALKQSC